MMLALSFVHTCTQLPAHTARNMHLINTAQPWSCMLLVFRLEGGTLALFHCQREVFFVFSFRNVKVAAQGHYCFGDKKTPLIWFKGRSNEMSHVLPFSSIKSMYL